MVAMLQASDATTLPGLISDLNAAFDYSQYASNPLAFDVSVALSNSTTTLQIWQTELARIQTLGLDQTLPAVTAANAASVAAQAGVKSVVVYDTAANEVAKLASLKTLATANKLAAVSATDGGVFQLTATQLTTYTTVMSKVLGLNEMAFVDANKAETLTGTPGGNNAISFANETKGMTINLATGTATPVSGTVFTDKFSGFQIVAGSHYADKITAGAPNQTLTGNGGADALVGYSGGSTTFSDTAKNLTTTTISGFIPTDMIDIKDMAPLPKTFKFTQTASSYGTLTATSGATTTPIKLNGTFAHGGIYATADGKGGTLIGDVSSSDLAAFKTAHPTDYIFG